MSTKAAFLSFTKKQKIIIRKGKHQNAGVSSAEKKINTIIICCADAAGQCKMPSMIIKKKHMAFELVIDSGSIVTISDTACLNCKLLLNN